MPDLMPYQQAGVMFLTRRNVAILADDMGLGKTPQAIVAADLLLQQNSVKHVVIICPAAVCRQWGAEIKRWVGADSYLAECVIHDLYPPEVTWAVIPYSRIGDITELLPDTVLILDEMHYLKSPKSTRTKQIWGQLRMSAARVWGLTGTPIPNRPIEIAHIMTAIAPAQFPDYQEFVNAYCAPRKAFSHGRHFIVYEESENLGGLADKLKESKVMIRRMKREVLKDLPEKRRVITMLDIEPAQLAESERRIREFVDEKKQDEMIAALVAGNPLPAFELMAQARKELGICKAKAVAEWIGEQVIDSPTKKFLVFFWHKDAIEEFYKCLPGCGVAGCYKIDGAVPAAMRQRIIDTFKKDNVCNILAASIGSCGTGVDGLQHITDTVIFAEASYVPGENWQAEDRVCRMGQIRGVLVHYLTTEIALDKRVMQILANKKEMLDKILG